MVAFSSLQRSIIPSYFLSDSISNSNGKATLLASKRLGWIVCCRSENGHARRRNTDDENSKAAENNRYEFYYHMLRIQAIHQSGG